jgi:hypothetical protein
MSHSNATPPRASAPSTLPPISLPLQPNFLSPGNLRLLAQARAVESERRAVELVTQRALDIRPKYEMIQLASSVR